MLPANATTERSRARIPVMAATRSAVGYVSFVDWCRLTCSSRRHDVVAPGGKAEACQCSVGEHFVDVHVRRRARAALERIDNDMLVEFAPSHLLARGAERGRDVVGKAAELGVHPGARQLNETIGVYELAVDGAPGKREVLDCSRSVNAPQGIPRNAALTEQVDFDA